jgi:hypothetical protein
MVWRFESQRGQEIFSLLQNLPTGYAVHSASYSFWVPEVLSEGKGVQGVMLTSQLQLAPR